MKFSIYLNRRVFVMQCFQRCSTYFSLTLLYCSKSHRVGAYKTVLQCTESISMNTLETCVYYVCHSLYLHKLYICSTTMSCICLSLNKFILCYVMIIRTYSTISLRSYLCSTLGVKIDKEISVKIFLSQVSTGFYFLNQFICMDTYLFRTLLKSK